MLGVVGVGGRVKEVGVCIGMFLVYGSGESKVVNGDYKIKESNRRVRGSIGEVKSRMKGFNKRNKVVELFMGK